MRLSWQVTARIFIAALAVCSFFFSLAWIFIGDNAHKTDLPPGSYALYLSIFIFSWIYSDSTFFDRAVIAARSVFVRTAFCTIAVLVGVATWLRLSAVESQPFHRTAIYFWGISFGYTLIFFVSIFGPAFLGVFAKILKLGRRA